MDFHQKYAHADEWLRKANRRVVGMATLTHTPEACLRSMQLPRKKDVYATVVALAILAIGAMNKCSIQ